MNNIILIGTVGTLISLVIYKGYYYGKKELYRYVMKKVNEELDNRMENEEELFKPMHKNSALIKVTHAGKSHSIYVPYDRRKSTTMLTKKVYLIKNEEKIDISQKPGIPYLVSASQLGGTSIIIEDLYGEIVKTYSENEVPIF